MIAGLSIQCPDKSAGNRNSEPTIYYANVISSFKRLDELWTYSPIYN